MIRNQDILKSLPLLASILGRNYGVQVQIGGNLAYTDGNTIHIPSLPLECDEELLHFARGYIDHESAHIRFTDFEVLQEAKLDPVTHHLWNSIEDWRVEEKLSAFYPGCKQHFRWLARKIFVEDEDKKQEEPGDKPSSSILKYILLSVRSWNMEDIKMPLQNTISFIDAHFQGLRLQIDAVLERVHESCQNTQDAISYAREIAEIIKEWKPNETCASPIQSQSQSSKQEDTSASHKRENTDSSSSKQGTSESMSDEDMPQSHPQHPNGDQEADCGTNSKSETQSQHNDPTQDIADLFASKEGDLPKALGEQIGSILQTGQADDQDMSITVATVGKVGHCTVSQDEKESALRASVALRSRLHGVLQAKIRQNGTIGRRGSLSTRHLYRLQIGNSQVFKSKEEKNGYDTAVHILLDVSSSMSGTSLQLARQSCYAVVKALSSIKGINTAVTAFPSEGLVEHSVAPLMKHGEKIPQYFAIKAIGSTPLAEALWWVMQTMQALRERRKIILILTDGVPNSVPNAMAALDIAQKTGFEVYGIGIMTNSIRQLLPKTSLPIYKINELTETMFKLLQFTLLRGVESNLTKF